MGLIDIRGQKFGKLEVIERAGSDKHKKATWLCRCDCGRETIVNGSDLRSGNTKSCGCTKADIAIVQAENNKTHGMRNSRLYTIWRGMKSRCYNQNHRYYKHYGGRGITVCDEWRNDFKPFMEWALSNGYQDNLTIDRIETNGNYEPSNCRWATETEQKNNMRNNRTIEFNGETHNVAEWASITGLSYNVIWKRLKAGLTPNEIFKDSHKKGRD